MIRRLLAIATTVALAAVVAAAPARGATVDLRVDSSSESAPLFDASVTTLPHPVDGNDGSGAHPCAGPAGATPSASATGALDEAMRAAGIPWRGNWDPSFRDFFVDRIGPYASAAPDRYWSLTVNDQFASGGCLATVEDGDSVHFFYGPLFGAGAPAADGEPGGPAGPGTGAAGLDPAAADVARRTRAVARRAAAFLHRNRNGAGAPWGRLALALRDGRGVADAAAALIADAPEQSADGSFGADVNTTAIAVLALAQRHSRAAARAARWLVSVQDPGGGFGFRPGVTPDLDTTGLAAWALAREGRWRALRGAGLFVRAAQAADGGFPSLPGGSSNSQSTGLALVALRVGGLGPRPRSSTGRTPLDFLSSLSRPGGSIAYADGIASTPVWTTAQALLGLTARMKLLMPDPTPPS